MELAKLIAPDGPWGKAQTRRNALPRLAGVVGCPLGAEAEEAGPFGSWLEG